MIKKEKNRKTNKIVKEDEIENKSFFKKNEKQIVGVFLFFMFILVCVVIKVSDNNLKKRLLENPGYSIATVIDYTEGGLNFPSHSTAQIIYYVNDKKIEKTVFDGVIRPCEPGSQYVILYNKKDSDEAWLLMEYRIIRDGDFQKYMEELKTKQPVLMR